MSADFRTCRLESEAESVSPYLRRPLRSYAQCLRQRILRHGGKVIREELRRARDPARLARTADPKQDRR